MDRKNTRLDLLLGFILVMVLAGLPATIWTYERHYWQGRIPADAKIFTLTGHTDRGWILGEVEAKDILSTPSREGPRTKPIIKVRQGDTVVLKLKSSDVIHGFSFQEAGIIIDDGIKPGKVILVTFKAERPGSYQFSCNAICGRNHERMQGTILVSA